MEQNPETPAYKLIHTLGWIVGKTLVLTSKMLIIGFRLGLEFIISKLKTEPGQRNLPDYKPVNTDTTNTI